MNEPAVTDRIVKALCGTSCTHARKRHSGKFGSGEPDVTGCCIGRAFYIEVKMSRGELSQLQAHQLTNWREAGALTAMAIYDPPTKQLKVVRLCDSEAWEQFTGPRKVAELWETTAERAQVLSKYDWQEWLETNIGRKS